MREGGHERNIPTGFYIHAKRLLEQLGRVVITDP